MAIVKTFMELPISNTTIYFIDSSLKGSNYPNYYTCTFARTCNSIGFFVDVALLLLEYPPRHYLLSFLQDL